MAPLVAAALVFAFAGGALAQAPEADGSATVVKVGAERIPVLRDRADAVAAGRALFAEHCRYCHGDDGSGDPFGAPDLTDGHWRWGSGSYAEIATIVTAGLPGTTMPRWRDRMTAEQRAQVTAYVYSLSRRNGDRPDGPPPAFDAFAPTLVGDPDAIRAGKRTFHIHCSTCHGAQAMGSREAPNLTDAEWRNGNGTYRDIVTIVTLGVGSKGMPDWYSTLNPRRIREVAAFVLHLQDCPTELYDSCLDPR